MLKCHESDVASHVSCNMCEISVNTSMLTDLVYVLNPGRLAGIQLNVEEIALSTDVQIRKLDAILTAVNETFELNEETAKWNVKREPIRSVLVNDLLTYL